jgi:hypothetical protein
MGKWTYEGNKKTDSRQINWEYDVNWIELAQGRILR